MVTLFGWALNTYVISIAFHLFLFDITVVLSSHSSLASETMEDPILEMSQVLTVMGIEIIGPLSPFGRASSQFKYKHKFYFCSQHHFPPVPGWVSR